MRQPQLLTQEEEEIKKISREKGHDALAWYAWRNALRALPVLGYCPIENIWPQDTVRHVVAVCRVYCVMAQWENVSKLAVSSVRTDTAAAANAAAAAAQSSAVTSVAKAAAAAAYTNAIVARDAAVTAYRIVNGSARDAVAYADADCKLLRQQSALTPGWWGSHLLWDSTRLGMREGEPTYAPT